jgi:UDP-N-acetylglucosamine 4-epimerase
MYEKPFHTADLSTSTFLVTGGAGFIGSNIIEYLLKHNAGKVIAFDNLSTGFDNNVEIFRKYSNFSFVQGDIRDANDCGNACKGVDYVFHQAALGSVPRSIKNPIDTHNVNATGFINMMIAAKENNVKRIVYASSSSVYGDSKALPKVEEQIGKQLSPYAVSKMTNELYGEIFAKTYGLEIIGLRYFNIFGPRQNPAGEYAAAIPLFINSLLNDESPKINGDGEQTRDFTFVANAVQANIRAMFAEGVKTDGDVYNIAVGERVSLNELISVLKKLTKKENIEVVHRTDRPGDVRDSLADITKAQKALKYFPEVKIEEGLRLTLEWFLSDKQKN